MGFGITTRLADNYIQNLFMLKKVEIVDHKDHARLWCIIMNRLKLEHRDVKINADRKSLTICLVS